MELKDAVKNYKLPVDESAWGSIAKDAQLVRFNRRKRLQRICLLGVVPAIVVAVVVTTVLLSSSPKKSEGKSEQTIAPQEMVMPQTESATLDNQNVTDEVRNASPVVAEIVAPNAMPVQPSVSVAEEKSAVVTSSAPQVSLPSVPAVVQTEKRAPVMPAVPSSVSKPAKSVPASSVKNQDDNAHSSEEPETPAINYQLFIPNAFTPNGDGINDLFKVEADFAPLSFEIAIYSRKGDLVFLNKDMKLGWDGSFRGQDLPSEVYSYVVKFTNPEGKQSTRRGQVTLIR